MQGLRQVRPIDPVLTRIVVDFMNSDDSYSIPKIFPAVRTPGDTVTIYKGDAENSLRYEDPNWARNKEATVIDIRFGSDSYTVVPRALKTLITESDRRNFLGDIDLGTFAMRKLTDKMKLAREVKGESLIRNSSNIGGTAAGAAWNAASLDPPKDFQARNAACIKATGVRLNTIVFPPGLWDARFATVGANTAGNLIRSQLGYLLLATTQNVTPTVAARWMGADNGYVPYAAKAGGAETATPAKDGATSGAYVWSDTTVCYYFAIDPNPAQGVTTYGLTLGPEEQPTADVPFDSWDPWGTWYRVMHIANEFEVTAKASGKTTGC